ncbi:MAG: hypothetical protein J1F06_05425 [Prevotellaceae bacterium]|nr:hypothetical protein [Prevotellaceae bacterium]
MRFHLFAGESWGRADCLSLPVDTVAASGEYDLTLLLRTSAAGLSVCKTIYLNVREEGLQLSPPLNDTLAVSLDNEQMRKGRNGVAYHEIAIPVRRVRLKRGMCGNLLISHAMAADSLTGISELGYRLEPAAPFPADAGGL